VLAWAEDTAANGDTAWKRWAARVEQVRSLAAQLLHAAPDEIALVRNTTEGINLVAEGFPWQPGDNVVVPAGEFPTNLYPWLALRDRGVDVRLVPADLGRLDLDRLAAACDARTRIVAVSWVDYATGWRVDVDALVELAHRRGALVCLDAIQGLGVFPLDVSRTAVDFLAADGHKWLLAPEGAGIFYIRREHLARLRPMGIGWNSVRHAGQYDNPALDLKPTAARYEGGTYPMAGFLGLAASLEMILSYGVERIGPRVLNRADRLRERLAAIGAELASPADPPGRSGIVSFTLPGRDPQLVRRACLERDVVLRCRAGRLRASPHAYNNDEDIERLVTALGSMT
jgi:cysteine desulfurase/selenocysteine lyase